MTETASAGRPADHVAALDAVERISIKACDRAAEIDDARAFPADLFAELVGSGAFRALLPREHGGLDMPMSLMNEMTTIAARANGSMGWMMLVGAPQGLGLGLLPELKGREMLARNPLPMIRGAIAPKGRAEPVDGGYRVSGRWPFASGGPATDFVGGNCLVYRDGEPHIGANGVLEARICIIPADRAKYLDTWHVLGMRGTDSCDVVFEDVFVPEEMSYNIFTTKSFLGNTAARLPFRVLLSFGHAALALGIAQGALDDITALAVGKRPSMQPGATLGEDAVFRHSLGEQMLRLEAGQAFLDKVTADIWGTSERREELSPRQILVARTMSMFITRECVNVVDWAYTIAGSHSVYDSSSLQRRLRDIHVATQHAAVHTNAYRVLAAAALGDDIPPMELF
jgi:alkylation response protein AidB-like acyl-CoA dehydrogenase